MAAFTAIATTVLGVAGAGMSAAGGIASKKRQRDAERAADEALASAKRNLSVNRMEGLQVPVESYTQAMREVTSQQGQAIDALTESDSRSLAAGIGKLGASAANATEAQRLKMDQAIYDRDTFIAKEDARIDQNLASLDLQEVRGAQQAAAQSEQAAAQQFSGATSGLGSVANTLYQNKALYGKNKEAFEEQRIEQEKVRLRNELNLSASKSVNKFVVPDSPNNFTGLQGASAFPVMPVLLPKIK